jgi:hypothetical protein
MWVQLHYWDMTIICIRVPWPTMNTQNNFVFSSLQRYYPTSFLLLLLLLLGIKIRFLPPPTSSGSRLSCYQEKEGGGKNVQTTIESLGWLKRPFELYICIKNKALWLINSKQTKKYKTSFFNSLSFLSLFWIGNFCFVQFLPVVSRSTLPVFFFNANKSPGWL